MGEKMNRLEECKFKAEVLKWIREFFEMEGITEMRYNQFSFAGSCENAPTTYWIDKMGEFLMLPQTRQILAERDLIIEGFKAVWMMQTSYRDEPRAGDGRHCNQFLLCEMEHMDMSQDELIDFEERMLKYCIRRALQYFVDNKIVSENTIRRLEETYGTNIPRISYTQVIEDLQSHGITIQWGDDLKSRDEEFICNLYCSEDGIPLPVAVYDYPEKLKYFNMYLKRESQDTDKEVVECCDILLPFAGETWGSSRRENEGNRIRERFYNGTMYKQLRERLTEKTGDEYKAIRIIEEAFEPYFQLFDKEPHDRAGFGLGVGRLIQFLLGLNRIVEI